MAFTKKIGSAVLGIMALSALAVPGVALASTSSTSGNVAGRSYIFTSDDDADDAVDFADDNSSIPLTVVFDDDDDADDIEDWLDTAGAYIDTLIINNDDIDDIDVSDATNVTKFVITCDDLTDIDGLDELGSGSDDGSVIVDITAPDLSDIDFDGNDALYELTLHSDLESLDVSDLENLTILDVSGCPELTSLDMSDNDELDSLNIAGTDIDDLDTSDTSITKMTNTWVQNASDQGLYIGGQAASNEMKSNFNSSMFSAQQVVQVNNNQVNNTPQSMCIHRW